MWAGAGWVSPSASPLENVLVCLEARLILPLNHGRKWILDSGLKVGPSECEDQTLWRFQQANATACLEAGAGGTAGFINNTPLFIGAAHPNPNLPLLNSGLFTAA